MYAVQATLAEVGRKTIQQKTQMSMNYLGEKGMRRGAIPYGFAVDADGKTLIENPAEMQIITLANEMQHKGSTLTAICDRLEGLNLLSRTGKRFHPTQIRRMLEGYRVPAKRQDAEFHRRILLRL